MSRHWGQEKASESAERKRKRPAVAATGLGATTDDDDNNDDMDQNASGTDSGGGGVSGMGAWMGSGVGSGAGGPVPMTKAQVTAATSQAKKVGYLTCSIVDTVRAVDITLPDIVFRTRFSRGARAYAAETAGLSKDLKRWFQGYRYWCDRHRRC